MRFLPVTLLFFSLLAVTSCNRNADSTEDDQKKADSLSVALNSPELKEANARILEEPSNADRYEARSLVYRNLHQFEPAENDIKRAIKLDSTNSKRYALLVDCYFIQNKTRMAREVLEVMEKKFPDNIECRMKLAEIFFAVKKYQEAIEYVNKSLKIDEHHAPAYFLKGNIYRESGDTAKAISSIQTAVEQDNNYSAAYHDLGLLYAARKNPIALEYYANALKSNPTSTLTLYARAMFLQSVNKFDDAWKEYENITKMDSTCAQCFFNLGALALDVKRDSKIAVQYFTRAISAEPSYLLAYYWRGFANQKLNNKAAAIDDFEMCLRLDENFEPAITALNGLK